jgi:hypothetical protein
MSASEGGICVIELLTFRTARCEWCSRFADVGRHNFRKTLEQKSQQIVWNRW